MILKDLKTGEEITTKNKSLVARKIGVSRMTIHRWFLLGKRQKYNYWVLTF